jgi:hypothetical protein
MPARLQASRGHDLLTIQQQTWGSIASVSDGFSAGHAWRLHFLAATLRNLRSERIAE